MTIDRARGYIATSQAVHALYGLGTPDEFSRTILSSSHFFASRKLEGAAFMEARFQVLSVYLECGGNEKQLAQAVQNTLTGAPYITVSDGTAACTPCFAIWHSGTGAGAPPPPSGYTPEAAGLAIIRALKEWLQGQHCDLTTGNLSDIEAIQHFKTCETKAVDYLRKVKERHPAMWVQLSKDIIDIHVPKPTCLPNLILGPYGIPDQVISEDMMY
ncbi:hypothetical protein EDB19DRAFT_1839177 [Suillus lakei]|nr:hypothetical protein EDB19DRAFT_1839177 [Suillus lakei]